MEEHINRIPFSGFGAEAERIPKHCSLYKFRNFLDVHSLAILRENTVYFSSPTGFNDPFDSKVLLAFDDGSDDEMLRFWTAELEKLNVESGLRKKAAEQIITSGVLKSKVTAEDLQRLSDEFLIPIGICSLSATHKNLLLWSHYADSHKGFAIGFDLRKLFLSCFEQTGNKIALEKVAYSSMCPRFSPYRKYAIDQVVTLLLTKSNDWEYEQEYRLLFPNGQNRSVRFKDGVVKRVILGCQISDENRDEIISILKNRRDHPSLFEAKKKKGRFGLDFRWIDY